MWIAVLKDTREVIARNQYAILCSLAASNITNGDKSLYIITKEDYPSWYIRGYFAP